VGSNKGGYHVKWSIHPPDGCGGPHRHRGNHLI